MARRKIFSLVFQYHEQVLKGAILLKTTFCSSEAWPCAMWVRQYLPRKYGKAQGVIFFIAIVRSQQDVVPCGIFRTRVCAQLESGFFVVCRSWKNISSSRIMPACTVLLPVQSELYELYCTDFGVLYAALLYWCIML